MKQLKVMTIVGTRPEIIKLSLILKELEISSKHVLVHTGQNYDYELNKIFFDELGLKKPDYFLDAAGNTPSETIGNVITKSDHVISKEKPDAFLIYGDTNSCMSALAAKRHKIPVFHIEAGNRSFDERVPEEINRRIIDHISDINMPLTEHAKNYLIYEGINPEMIIKIGSCMQEVLESYKSNIESSSILDKLKLNTDEYLLVSAHREENVDIEERLLELLKTLNELEKKYNKKIIFSVHPRTKSKIEKLKDITLNNNIKFLKPFGFFDYVKLQKNAFCIISDSGTITEESSLLNLPSIMIRQAHERPEIMEESTLLMSDIKRDEILNALELVIRHHDKKNSNFTTVTDYIGGKTSLKVVRTIFSYVSFINRVVWRKY